MFSFPTLFGGGGAKGNATAEAIPVFGGWHAGHRYGDLCENQG